MREEQEAGVSAEERRRRGGVAARSARLGGGVLTLVTAAPLSGWKARPIPTMRTLSPKPTAVHAAASERRAFFVSQHT